MLLVVLDVVFRSVAESLNVPPVEFAIAKFVVAGTAGVVGRVDVPAAKSVVEGGKWVDDAERLLLMLQKDAK